MIHDERIVHMMNKRDSVTITFGTVSDEIGVRTLDAQSFEMRENQLTGLTLESARQDAL